MSRDLVARGVGSVCPPTCDAHMPATGMVHDHRVGCFRYRETQQLSA